MKKNETVLIDITALDFEGKGIGHVDGQVVFVAGALPGERAEVLLIKVTSSFAVGKLLRILTPSPERVEPPCPYYAQCGGCSLMHLQYEAQLITKRQTVYDALSRIGGVASPEVLPTVGMANPYRYRNKAQFPIAEGNVGMYSTRSHRLVAVDDCLIGDESDRTIIATVKRYLAVSPDRSYDETTGKGLLRHLITKACTGGKMVILVVNGDSLPDEKKLTEALLADAVSVYLNTNRERTNCILGEHVRLLGGTPTVTDEMLGITAEIGPLSFRQVNREQTEKLYTLAVEAAHLTGKETVFDAYCGAGVMSLLAARKAARVIGVEIVPEAVEAAKANATRNGFTNAEFICGECETVYPKLIADGIHADTILLDPPRKGCEESLLHSLTTLQAERIVYVSCNPATLARDVKILCADGYSFISAQPVDMFPHTGHVETVVLLSKLVEAKHRITVELKTDELDLTPAEAKASYEEIRDYVKQKYNLTVSHLNIAQVKRKNGIIERENYNLPKNADSKQPKCTPEKEAAITEALRHFKMIK